MLHDKACKWHGEVIAKAFFAYFQGERLAVIEVIAALDLVIIIIYMRKGISRIENTEKEFVTFIAIFSKQGAQILH